MASAFVYVTHFLGDPERVDMNLLKRLVPFRCRILFCLNQCSRREDSLQSAEQVEMYRMRWQTYISSQLEKMLEDQGEEEGEEDHASQADEILSLGVGANGDAQAINQAGGKVAVDVLLTDFTACNPRLRAIGVKDVSDVRQWVRRHLSDLDLLDASAEAFVSGISSAL